MSDVKESDRKTKRGHEASPAEQGASDAKTVEVASIGDGGDDGAVEGPDIDEVLGAIDAAVMPEGSGDADGEAAPRGDSGPRAKTVPYGAVELDKVAREDGAPSTAVPERASKSQSTPLAPAVAVELLSRVNIFADLPQPFLKRVASICEEERHPYGAKIFNEGDAGDCLYLIHEGAVRISRDVPGMGEEALAVLKAGDYFGEMALIDDFPRSANAVAHEACRLVVIGKDKLADLLFVDRDLAYDLLWTFVRTLSGRLRQTNDKMTFMAVTSKF